MPAEWEPHAATWLAWPHNKNDWPDKFSPIPWVYGEIVRHLGPGELVRILVKSTAHESHARRLLEKCGVSAGWVQFLRFPTNRAWTRDYGPIFIKQENPAGPAAQLAIARFHFNAWAKYKDWKRDDAVPDRAAKRFGIRAFAPRVRGRPVVLEGGSIDVNGEGALLTTEECLLDPEVQVRNPGLGMADIEAVLRSTLAVDQIIWLGRGIAGDDTHGHVDDVCRFVNPTTVVLCCEPDSADPNHRPLAENRERLQTARVRNGSKLEIIDLPMPEPLYFKGRRLPASYANFYIANPAVLVPTFNDPNDRVALGILAELFRDRPVIGIHAVDLVWGLGTLHCMTQQEPKT